MNSQSSATLLVHSTLKTQQISKKFGEKGSLNFLLLMLELMVSFMLITLVQWWCDINHKVIMLVTCLIKKFLHIINEDNITNGPHQTVYRSNEISSFDHISK